MRLYLSSYKLGDRTDLLKQWLSDNPRIGYVPNALDFSKADRAKVEQHCAADMALLREQGLDVRRIDLREHFGKSETLQTLIAELGGLWISGGNVFVLRQAMKLSGLDDILLHLHRPDFVYGGYSAAGCVLSSRLDAYQIVDDATDLPYHTQRETLWDGLGLIPYVFLPHADSDHPESSDIANEIRYCEGHGIPYKALRDGEVLVMESET